MTDHQLAVSRDVRAGGKDHAGRGDREVARLVVGAVEEVGDVATVDDVGERCNAGAAVGERDVDRPEVASVDDRSIGVDQAVHDEVIAIAAQVAWLSDRRIRRVVGNGDLAAAGGSRERCARVEPDAETTDCDDCACDAESPRSAEMSEHDCLSAERVLRNVVRPNAFTCRSFGLFRLLTPPFLGNRRRGGEKYQA